VYRSEGSLGQGGVVFIRGEVCSMLNGVQIYLYSQ
jgi:hypothetical protein